MPQKEREILFSAEMVRTVLKETKIQIHRVANPQPYMLPQCDYVDGIWYAEDKYGYSHPVPCPYGQPGDRLWVRETWRTSAAYNPYSPSQIDPGAPVLWVADGSCRENGPINWGKTRPSTHMPRWARRITLELVSASWGKILRKNEPKPWVWVIKLRKET